MKKLFKVNLLLTGFLFLFIFSASDVKYLHHDDGKHKFYKLFEEAGGVGYLTMYCFPDYVFSCKVQVCVIPGSSEDCPCTFDVE